MTINIYSPFFNEIKWIKSRIISEIDILPESLLSLTDYYMKKRLQISIDESSVHRFFPQIGRPVPYAVFWFSDNFGFKDTLIIKKLALAMVYSSIATTIRDDIVDGEAKSCFNCFRLYKFFYHLYLKTFEGLFSKDSKFWYILSESFREHEEYEIWRLSQIDLMSMDPYSDEYLRESSRYFSEVVYEWLEEMWSYCSLVY